jgi:dihydroxyacetone kinase-like protein
MNILNKSSRRLNPEFQVRFTGQNLRQWMTLFAASVRETEPRLNELDAALGDGDHGANLRTGMDAVVEKLDGLALADVAGQMRVIATTLTTAVGGASGPLYGAFFLQSSHGALHKPDLGLGDLTSAMEAGYRGVVQLGRAAVGDKTMVDPLAAAVRSLRASCMHYQALPEAVRACRKAAQLAAEGTLAMIARKGLAAEVGEAGIGVMDPGALSVALLFESLAQAVSSLTPTVHSQAQSPIFF